MAVRVYVNHDGTFERSVESPTSAVVPGKGSYIDIAPAAGLHMIYLTSADATMSNPSRPSSYTRIDILP